MTTNLSLCLIFAFLPTAVASQAQDHWWERFPLSAWSNSGAFTPVDAARLGARVWIGLYGMDTASGPFGQRVGSIECAPYFQMATKSGLRYLSWMEAFGGPFLYAVALTQNPDGSFVGQSADTSTKRLGWIKDRDYPKHDQKNAWVSRLDRSAWHWGKDGSNDGNAYRWVGIPNTANDEDFVRPLFTTERLGFPIPTYPDGRAATGFFPGGAYPLNAKVYDAVFAKDVNGDLVSDMDQKRVENDPSTGLPKDPIDGLYGRPVRYTDLVLMPSAKVGEAVYTPLILLHKDSAAPFWIDYARVMVRPILKDGIDGLWCDNFSPCDSFGMPPIFNGFGEWSVYGFRSYLAEHFSPAQLASMGVGDPGTFNVRDYLKRKASEYGAARPEDIRDPKWWQDKRWLDEPVWCAYKAFKQETGRSALRGFYDAIKDEARKAGRPDFLVAGNDVPIFTLGWVRDDYLDMVSMEATPGWFVATGSRGITLPPQGKYAVVYRAALEFQKGPHGVVWYYLNGDYQRYQKRPEIAKVLMAEAFANSFFLKYGPSLYPGTNECVKWWNSFLANNESKFGRRTQLADVGIVYSPDNQLAFVVPGSHAMNHDYQPHSFAHWGFATAMIDAHIPYRVVTDWKLRPATLRNLRALVLPNVECLDDSALPTLDAWVRSGGRLVLTGPVGARRGTNGFFARRRTPLLNALTGCDVSQSPGISQAGYASKTATIASSAADIRSWDGEASTTDASKLVIPTHCRVHERKIGKGTVVWTPDAVDIAYYLEMDLRAKLLGELTMLVGESSVINAEGVPSSTGIFCWKSATGTSVFADLVNYDLDADADKTTPAKDTKFRMRAPENARTVRAVTLTPDRTSPARAVIKNGWASVLLPELVHFASVKLEFGKTKGGTAD